ncbi:MAG: IS1182 family transposase [Candidatus Eiseniibacteriota bacterium]
MSKTFRAWDVDQAWLLPPSVHQFVPPGHLAHFVRDTVREALDLSAITGIYKAEQGQPPYHPGMLVALLLYGYSRGIYSSRQLARACEERVDVMAVTGLNQPDFRTISDFRCRHLPALQQLFVQVLRLCQAAGLVKLGHVAVDGTKLRANASKHKAMSYKHMVSQEPKLAAEVASWLDQADAADAAEDAQHGADRRGDETPDWMADKQRRLERIHAAKAQLEAEAKAGPGSADPDGPGPSSGMQERGARKDRSAATPPDKAQRNFTDPDSRIMPSGGGFIAGYNGQIAVDAAHQIIVAQRLGTNPADFAALIPLIDQGRANLGRKPREVSGDTGFATEANLEAMAERRVRAYLSPGRIRHGETDPAAGRVLKRRPRMQAMAETIRRAGRRSRYRLRKQVVEPVFGHIKQARGFRQFLLRGLDKVRGEWAMVCTVHNILKLHRAAA